MIGISRKATLEPHFKRYTSIKKISIAAASPQSSSLSLSKLHTDIDGNNDVRGNALLEIVRGLNAPLTDKPTREDLMTLLAELSNIQSGAILQVFEMVETLVKSTGRGFRDNEEEVTNAWLVLRNISREGEVACKTLCSTPKLAEAMTNQLKGSILGPMVDAMELCTNLAKENYKAMAVFPGLAQGVVHQLENPTSKCQNKR